MKDTFTCQHCLSVFTPKDSHTQRPHLFCSRQCKSLNFSKTHPRKTDKEYYEKRFSIPSNREKKRESDRKYSEKNRETLRVKAIEYYHNNKLLVSAKQRDYAERNKEKRKAYCLENKDRIRDNHAKWSSKKRKEDAMYRLHDNLTSLIGMSLRKGKNGKRTSEVLGYTMAALRKRLESKFKDGMTWDNYGQWHLDHIVPLRAFNITTVDDIDFKKAWALTNLQPLWGHDNLVKSGKIARPFQPSLAIVA